MPFERHATTDSATALAAAGAHLVANPLQNNVILTLLEDAYDPHDQRFWWVTDVDTGQVAGALYQGPLAYPALLSAIDSRAAVGALADAVAESIDRPEVSFGTPLHAVRGIVTYAACFAGAYAARTHQPGVVDEAFRMLACHHVSIPAVAGHARIATLADRDLVIDWTVAFQAAISGKPMDRDGAAQMMDGRFERGEVLVWEVDGNPTSMVSSVPSTTTNVTRVGIVYTPPEHQRRGYAAAVTAAITHRILAEGRAAMLLTQLSNPTSNAVYRSIGYEAIDEELVYRFG